MDFTTEIANWIGLSSGQIEENRDKNGLSYSLNIPWKITPKVAPHNRKAKLNP